MPTPPLTIPDKKQYKTHSASKFGACAANPMRAPPAIPVKKQYKVHVEQIYCVMLVSPASTLYCYLTGTAGVPAYCLLCARPPSLSKNNTNCSPRLNMDHARPPRDPCEVIFDRDLACLARLGPRGASRAWRAWHAWRTSPQRRAHGVAAGSQ